MPTLYRSSPLTPATTDQPTPTADRGRFFALPTPHSKPPTASLQITTTCDCGHSARGGGSGYSAHFNLFLEVGNEPDTHRQSARRASRKLWEPPAFTPDHGIRKSSALADCNDARADYLARCCPVVLRWQEEAPVNSVEMLEDADIDGRYVALEPADEERRIRRGMRLKARTWSKRTNRVLPPAIIGGAALLTGGFCLGWKAFRFWRG
jgi:hypothetical protein